MKKYKVVKERESEFQNPLSVKKWEEVTCLEKSNPEGDWASWILCRTYDNEGWVPEQVVDIQEDFGLITEDYNAVEFNLVLNEILIKEKEMNGWIWCYKEEEPDKKAWAPLNHIKALE